MLNAKINTQENLITDESQLTNIFYNGAKDECVLSQKRTGVEFEKLPVKKDTFKYAPYQDVAKFLLAYKEEKDGIYENGAILGLSNNDGTVTLEPGSQTELSLNPSSDLNSVKRFIDVYNKKTSQIAEQFGIYWLGYGIQPVSTYKNIHIIPKKRYEYMTKYLPTVAKKPLVMMRETSGIQASFDYKDEADAMRKFAFALKLSPIVSAAFANSPVRNGRLTKYKSNRAASWLDTDNDRCGLVSGKVFNSHFGFEDYAKILLDVPMIFIERTINGVKTAIRVENITFKEFIKHGWQGFRAEEQDWETHLSLYFPDVRLKTYIEIRNHDNQRSPLICAVPALWKGLIYNNDAMSAVEDMLCNLTYFDYEYLRRKTPQYGIDMKIKHHFVADIVYEIAKISAASLKLDGNNEEHLLDPLLELLAQKKTPADILIGKWENEWRADVSRLVQYSRLI